MLQLQFFTTHVAYDVYELLNDNNNKQRVLTNNTFSCNEQIFKLLKHMFEQCAAISTAKTFAAK